MIKLDLATEEWQVASAIVCCSSCEMANTGFEEVSRIVGLECICARCTATSIVDQAKSCLSRNYLRHGLNFYSRSVKTFVPL